MVRDFPKHLNICALPDDNFSNVDAIIDENNTLFHVYEAKFIHLLSEALHFSFNIKHPIDGQIGKHVGNDTWTGHIGMIQQKECDIAIDAISLTLERSRAISYSYPYYVSDITFLTNNPEALPKSFAIFHPFSFEIWIALIVAFFFMFIIFFAFHNKQTTYDRSLLTLIRPLVLQSIVFQPQKISGRLLLLSWIAGVMFITYSYQAVLLSILTFPQMSGVHNIPELAEAVKKGTHICMMFSGSFYGDVLKKSEDEALSIIGLSLEKHSIKYIEPKDFFATLTGKKGAYVSGRLLLSELKEILFLSEDSFFTNMYGMVVHKDFCCKSLLDKTVRKIWESGLYDRILREKIMTASLKYRFLSLDQEINHQISLGDLSGAFIFLIVGHVISSIVIIIELIMHNILSK